jgi:myo-inositol-1-phosphate synthase
LNLDSKLEVWDSPNSAGVDIDAVRCAKHCDEEARHMVEAFIAEYAQQPAPRRDAALVAD